jgi:hypothetical protein
MLMFFVWWQNSRVRKTAFKAIRRAKAGLRGAPSPRCPMAMMTTTTVASLTRSPAKCKWEPTAYMYGGAGLYREAEGHGEKQHAGRAAARRRNPQHCQGLCWVLFCFLKSDSLICQSINDLSVIFKDLALLIVDQGTILDRIDYNIEHAATSIDQGHKELEQVCLL